MSIEPEFPETKIMMTMAGVGTLMRARFPVALENPEALQLFLRGIAAWFGEPFCVVLDADSEEVYKHPERWARMLGDLDDAFITVQWSGYSSSCRKDPLKGTVGDFRKAKRLLTHAAVGQK